MAKQEDLVFNFKDRPLFPNLGYGEVELHQIALALHTQGLSARVMERDANFYWVEAFTGKKMHAPTRKVLFLEVGDDHYTAEGLVQWGKYLRTAHKELRTAGNRRFSDEGEVCHLSTPVPHVIDKHKLTVSAESLEEVGRNFMDKRIPRPSPRKVPAWPAVFQFARPNDQLPQEDFDGVESLLRAGVPRALGAKGVGAGIVEHATRGRNRPPAWLLRRAVAYASDTLLLLDHRLAVEYGAPLRRACVCHPGCWDTLTPEQQRLDPAFDPARVQLGMVAGADKVLHDFLGKTDLRNEPTLASLVKALDAGAQHSALQAKTPVEPAAPASRGPRL